MGQKQKLISRLLSNPKDFTFEEAKTLLAYMGFELENKGKTSGSRVIFTGKDNSSIRLHRPHPGNILKSYQIKQLIEFLNQEDLL